MKQTCLLLLSFFLALPLCAQFTISGKVLNAAQGDIVEMATVRLFSYPEGKDSVLVQGAQTDFEGEFYLTHIPKGNYRLFVSAIGFVEYSRAVELKGEDLALPTIRLSENIQHLAEVQVQGKAAEMTVKGDTIEYNTAAYQVGENAMVEDLLKKMNGVQVDKQGNVTVNGETITAVRIDGKKFFGNDVQSATKNIPAEMIDKIQVIDEKSETAKLTGFEDDDTEHIINLTLKQDRKRGVFGKYTGSIGADMVTENEGWFNYADPAYGATSSELAQHFFSDDFRYNANIFTNLLLGESQTTILGSANNTNEIRMGRGRGPWGQDANAGITQSENLGANTNVDFNSRITKKDAQTSLILGGDLSLSHSNNLTLSQTEQEQYAGDLTFSNTDSTYKRAQTWDVNLRLELQYQIDTLNKLIFQPTISYTSNSSHSSQDYTYFRQETISTDGYQNKRDTSHTIEADLKLTYNHKFLHPGRSLTLTGKLSFSNTDGFEQTYAFDRLLSLSNVDQYTLNRSNHLKYSLRTSYVEPIYSTNHLLETVLAFSGSDRRSAKDQYTLLPLLSNPLESAYSLDSTYSNALSNQFYTEQLELNYRWLTQKSDLTVGVRGIVSQTLSQTSYGGTLLRDTTIHTFNIAPSVNFRYKIGKKEFARIRYRGSVSQPTVNQMIPVRNNSDAMHETIGNLSLHPAFQHTLFSMYSRFNQERFSSMMAHFYASFTQNALVSNTIYDATGKRYSQTVNAEALPWNANVSFMYNTPFANKLFQFHTHTSLGYNQRVAYTSHLDAFDTQAIPLGELSLTGNTQLQENIDLRFTHQIVDIGLRANGKYSYTDNNITARSASHVFDWSVTGDITFHLPKSWNIATDCGYTARYGYQLDDVNEIILNARVEKSWSNATLALEAYDILHQKKNIVQVISDNMVSYAKYNTLPTYFLLSFTYRLNRMGKLKASGMGGHIQEMIENNGRPSGPPPFMR